MSKERKKLAPEPPVSGESEPVDDVTKLPEITAEDGEFVPTWVEWRRATDYKGWPVQLPELGPPIHIRPEKGSPTPRSQPGAN